MPQQASKPIFSPRHSQRVSVLGRCGLGVPFTTLVLQSGFSPFPRTFCMAECIRSRAPLRISFCGGGTDVSPFPEREGGCVLSATINLYAYATLVPRDDRLVCAESLDLGMTFSRDLASLEQDGTLDLVQTTLRVMGIDSGA